MKTPPTTQTPTLSLHDALPISLGAIAWHPEVADGTATPEAIAATLERTADLLGGVIDLVHCPHAAGPPRCWCRDRKSTRLNSSHLVISYAVFCLKKKKYIVDRH